MARAAMSLFLVFNEFFTIDFGKLNVRDLFHRLNQFHALATVCRIFFALLFANYDPRVPLLLLDPFSELFDLIPNLPLVFTLDPLYLPHHGDLLFRLPLQCPRLPQQFSLPPLLLLHHARHLGEDLEEVATAQLVEARVAHTSTTSRTRVWHWWSLLGQAGGR